MTPAFAKILGKAFHGGIDVSLQELIEALELSVEDLLGAALKVAEVLKELDLSLEPDIARGDLETRRVLATKVALLSDDIRVVIDDEEQQGVEFKSTLICDLRAFRESPTRLVKSDGVTHSVLKTICAFANSGGGRLLVGVEDDRCVCGLEPDLMVMRINRDGWENHLRSLINSRFWQGRLVNSFVRVGYVQLNGTDVAVIDVIARRQSTFLKHMREDRHEFYVRQGNRTIALDMHEFELHIHG